MPTPIIGVMGPGTGASTTDLKLAFCLGQQIAQSGWLLLTGGRNIGVMDAASRGAKSANGLTIGVLPTGDRHNLSQFVDIPILTDMGSARNNINILTSHVVIACGMGAGTASEVALAIKANKPVILLNSSPVSQAFFQSLTDQVFVARDVEVAIAQVKRILF